VSFAWTFPAGRRITKTISATAGNVVTNLSPGTGKRWLILRGRFYLTTDATTADRRIRLVITDGTNITERLGASHVISASSSGYLSFGETNVVDGGIYGDDGYIGTNPILLEGNDQLRITIDSGQAGDQYSGYVVLLEVDV